MKEQCPIGWVLWPCCQQAVSQDTRLLPRGSMSGTIALSVAPPGKLARWRFAALVDHSANRARKAIILNPVEHDGTDSEHASMALAPCLPVHRECQALLRLGVDPGRALDTRLVVVFFFIGIRNGRMHRRTAIQKRSQDKYANSFQRRNSTELFLIISNGIRATRDGHHIRIPGWPLRLVFGAGRASARFTPTLSAAISR